MLNSNVISKFILIICRFNYKMTKKPYKHRTVEQCSTGYILDLSRGKAKTRIIVKGNILK